MPLHIAGHAQVQYKDSFLLVGGRGGSNSSSEAPSKQIYEYNIEHGNWTLWSTSLSTEDPSLVSAVIIRDPCYDCSSAMDYDLGWECPRVVGTLLGFNRGMPLSHENQTSTRRLKVFQNLGPRGTDESRLGQLLACLADGVESASYYADLAVVKFEIFIVLVLAVPALFAFVKFLIIALIVALIGGTIIIPILSATYLAAVLVIVLGLKAGRYTHKCHFTNVSKQ